MIMEGGLCGHLFLRVVAVILFLGDVGDSPRQWRRECGDYEG